MRKFELLETGGAHCGLLGRLRVPIRTHLGKEPYSFLHGQVVGGIGKPADCSIMRTLHASRVTHVCTVHN